MIGKGWDAFAGGDPRKPQSVSNATRAGKDESSSAFQIS